MQPSCKKDDARKTLRAARLRRTQARQAVLAALVAHGRPMTHQQITALNGLKTMDKVTLYRTLATLRTAGLVHLVHGADGSALYCANCEGVGCPGGHPHFQCLECGQMRCIRGQQLPHLALDEPAVVKAKQFVAFGVCAACAKTAARQSATKRTKQREAAR